MGEKVKAVTDEDMEKAFTDESGRVITLSDPATEAAPASAKDETAPCGDKTVCDPMLVDLAFALAKRRIANPEFRRLARIWKALDASQRLYARNRYDHWGFKAYAKYFNRRRNLQSRLAQAGLAIPEKEMKHIRMQVRQIMNEVSEQSRKGDIPGFFFAPEFSFLTYKRQQERSLHGQVVEYKKKPVKLGAFVVVDVGSDMRDARIRFNKLPFMLGIDEARICAACPSCIESLRDYKFFNRTFTDRITHRTKEKPDLAYAQTYEAAQKTLEILQSRNKNQSAKPKELDEKSIGSQSCFTLSFDCLTEELDKQVNACTNELEIFQMISKFFQRFTPQQMGEVKIFLGENLGDVAEGKKAKGADDRGKPAGLGPFGGKPEDDDVNIYHDFKKLVSRVLHEWITRDGFFKRLVNGAIRECQNESGFEVAQVYARVARIEKRRDDVPHIYNLWLARMKSPHDGGQTMALKERREMNPNQKRFWIPLSEFFNMPTTGQGGLERCDRPYVSTQVNAAYFIRRFDLPIPPGMVECEARLNRIVRSHR
ncbi:MAG: hypothetical protein KGI60_01595 [Patescibacteria group bacterium]|nr:hypothetical protein [Patescibacteria group bacterium]